jgi:hypothetical protein
MVKFVDNRIDFWTLFINLNVLNLLTACFAMQIGRPCRLSKNTPVGLVVNTD